MRAPLLPGSREDLFGAAAIEDPHPLYARLRREAPVSRIDPTGVHLVASWELIDEALHREEDFSAHLTGVLVRDASGAPATFELPTTGANQVIATADEPEHGVHRGLVQPRLAPARVAGFEDAVRSWARSAWEELLAQGGGDVVPLAEALPARVVARLLGLPGEDAVRHRQWAMMGGDMLAGDVDAHRLGVLAAETGRMVEYLGAHLDAAGDAAEDPEDAPLLGVLARAVADGVVLRDQAIGIAVVLFGAGGESTAALIGSALRRLAVAPALQATLRTDPSLMPRFVEEVVRLETPFKFHYRVVRRACALGGFALEPGDRLMLLWASANRDAAIFEAPDELRLDRRHPKQHMGFGRGGHFCVGAGLARLEARVVVEELLTRSRRVALRPGDAPRHAPSLFVRRLERLALEIERR